MDAQATVSIVIGFFVVIAGVCLVVFRVPLSAAARDARIKMGIGNADSQTPTLYLFGGLFFALVGLVVVVGTATGLIHPR